MRLWMGPLLAAACTFIPNASGQFLTMPRFGLVTRNVAISDDAKDVYFAASVSPEGVADQVSNLYRYQSATRTVTKLTNLSSTTAPAPGLGVGWFSYPGSGPRVAYTALTMASTQIRVLDTETGADRLLNESRSACLPACISAIHMLRDGTIFYMDAGQDPFPFHIVKPYGSLIGLPVFRGAVAVSGQRIISDTGKLVFTSSAAHVATVGARATDVYVMNLDGAIFQPITHLQIPQIASDAVISADGSHVAFVLSSSSNTLLGAQEIWSSRTDGTELHRLSAGTADARDPSISADGKTVTFIQDGQVKRTSTLVDPLALIVPQDVTRLSTSFATSQVLSANGQQIATVLNLSSVYLATNDVTAQAVGLPALTRVFTPRVLYDVRSAAGYSDASAGSIATVWGANLSNEEPVTAQSLPLPTTLGGVELVMNGTALPLHAVTPWQINVHIPQSAAPGEAGFIVRGSNRNVTSEIRASILARRPEIITIPVEGLPIAIQAAAVYPGTIVLADNRHPASAGQILELYVFGLGVTTPRVAAGVASPANPPAVVDVRPRIALGDRELEVLFAGLVPGLAGVYQMNIRVPVGLQPGIQYFSWPDDSGSSLAEIYTK